jgi:hypothetical protein
VGVLISTTLREETIAQVYVSNALYFAFEQADLDIKPVSGIELVIWNVELVVVAHQDGRSPLSLALIQGPAQTGVCAHCQAERCRQY